MPIGKAVLLGAGELIDRPRNDDELRHNAFAAGIAGVLWVRWFEPLSGTAGC